MLPSTTSRVARNTADHVNEEIARRTRESIHRVAAQGPDAIRCRLRELDDEWDVERCLETMAPSFSLMGLGLAFTVSRKWLLLPLVVQAFFLQHALQGWCPPLAVLRRMGIRTMREIETERCALKGLLGEFANLAPRTDAPEQGVDAAIDAAAR